MELSEELAALADLPVESLVALAGSPEALSGLWEQSEVGSESYKKQQNLLAENKTRIDKVETRLELVKQLRLALRSACKQEHTLHQEWLTTEAEMQRALSPFSHSGIAAQLKESLLEQEAVAESILVEFNKGRYEVSDFVKDYLNARQVAQLKKYILSHVE